MTTLDEIYTFVPGEQTSWPVSTSSCGSLVVDLAAWRAIQAAPNYNAPVSWPISKDFAPLVDLFAEAQHSAGSWAPDTSAGHAEQQENARAFRESQLDVILQRGD
jgi:hypothetical protein